MQSTLKATLLKSAPLKAALAGAVALTLSAGLAPAFAGDGQPHIMSVRMPDGSLARIGYYGDTPPRIVILPATVAVAAQPFEAPIGFGPPFADLQQMAAMMDRQAELVMRQAAALQEAAMNGTLSDLPPAAQGYAVLAPPDGATVCMRSVQITYHGDGPPQVVSRSSGSCGSAQSTGAPSAVTVPVPVAPAPRTRPRTIEVKANAGRPVLAMAQPAVSER